MDHTVIARAAEFTQRPGDREILAKELLADLQTVASDNEMGGLIGKPDEISWTYTLFYSSSMRIDFDSASTVRRVFSDVMPTAQGEGTPAKQLDAHQIAAAAAEFRSQPYSRQTAAKKLIPSIKAGMTSGDIEAIFGLPDSRSWYYFLSSKGTAKLAIAFNPDGSLAEVRIIER